MRSEVDRGAGWRPGGGRGGGRAALGAGEEVVLVVVVGAGVGVQEGGGGGGVGEEREDGKVLAERGDGVADGGGVAAARAREDGARRGGEHAREAGAAEAVAAVEEQRRALILVVADVAERAARHPHRAAPRRARVGDGGFGPRRCPGVGRSGCGVCGEELDFLRGGGVESRGKGRGGGLVMMWWEPGRDDSTRLPACLLRPFVLSLSLSLGNGGGTVRGFVPSAVAISSSAWVFYFLSMSKRPNAQGRKVSLTRFKMIFVL